MIAITEPQPVGTVGTGSRQRWLPGAASRLEHAVVRRIAARLRGRPGWVVTVDPYVSSGTPERAWLRGRVLVRRRERAGAGTGPALLAGLARYATVEAAGERVVVEVAGRAVPAVSDDQGYVLADVDLPDVAPGWHDVRWRTGADVVSGRLLVVDPAARLGVVSDLDDTVIHTGLTRAWEAVRSTLLVPEHQRVPVTGAAELYRALVAGDLGRAPVFYVSAGAWNLHEMLAGFLVRHGFPPGPLLLSDWGPGSRWLFRQGTVAFKVATIAELMAEFPGLTWVLVGDSGQRDPEAYAAVVRAHPGRVRAVYILQVRHRSPMQTAAAGRLADEVGSWGVPMLLVPDSVRAAEHARRLGLVDEESVRRVRAAVRR